MGDIETTGEDGEEDLDENGGENESGKLQQAKVFKGMGCDSCLHPSCKHSAIRNGVCDCPGHSDSAAPCNGELILDVNSKPNWKLACNQCNTLLRFNAEIHSISILHQERCENCDLKLLEFEFNKLRTPLKDGETYRKGCLICDEFLSGLTEIKSGRTINLQVLKQMRAKRGGSGRGGRGRGRGRGRGKKKGMRKCRSVIFSGPDCTTNFQS